VYPILRLQRLLHQMRNALATPSRNARTAVVIGRLLAAAFLICFATGLYSHFLQDPEPWMTFPNRPLWLYQVSQGLHITAGIACFPLLFAKLYAVFPELFKSPPVRSFPHFLERASIAVFVAASVVQIVIGLLNTYQFYSLFPFSFRNTHYALSWVVIGSLVIHIAVKLPLIQQYWTKKDAYAPDGSLVPAVGEPEHDPDESFETRDEMQRLTGIPQTAGLTGRLFAWIDEKPAPRPPDENAGVSRRGFFATVAVATGALVALTAGQSFRVLDPINIFAPRKNDIGPQGLPVNRTAKAAKVLETATDPGWMLTVANGDEVRDFDRAALGAMPQTEAVLPIACVEGWSQYATWRGVQLRYLMSLVGAPEDARVRLTSLEDSRYGVSEMGPEFVTDELTLIALELEGETLDIDHGFPARAIAPARPGVLQTKWLTRLEVIR
jgi:DMSO/TMAO reductase YedYZ molybdopterin-dependent catalytic subunit